MEFSSPPRGLIVDLISPFKENGEIDGRGLGKQLDRIMPYAQAVLLSSPHAGEGVSLTYSHKEQLFEKALVVVRGQVPIFFWISGETPQKTEENLFGLKDILTKRKYSGPVYWVDSPLFYHSNRGLNQHYRKMASGISDPFVLLNDPDLVKGLSRPFKRSNIRTNILKDLSRSFLLQGLIFHGTLERSRNYQKAVRARADFRIYDGDEAKFLKYPSTSGVVSLGANLSPRAWATITASSLHLHGNQDYPDQLRQLWETGEYLNRLQKNYADHPVPLIKRTLWSMGIIEEPACAEPAAGDVEEGAGRLKALLQERGEV